jgi:hypothetical protein
MVWITKSLIFSSVMLSPNFCWNLKESIYFEVEQPFQDFLIGESVQRSGESVDTGGVGQIWVGQGRADQVGRVGAHVSSLVVAKI